MDVFGRIFDVFWHINVKGKFEIFDFPTPVWTLVTWPMVKKLKKGRNTVNLEGCSFRLVGRNPLYLSPPSRNPGGVSFFFKKSPNFQKISENARGSLLKHDICSLFSEYEPPESIWCANKFFFHDTIIYAKLMGLDWSSVGCGFGFKPKGDQSQKCDTCQLNDLACCARNLFFLQSSVNLSF